MNYSARKYVRLRWYQGDVFLSAQRTHLTLATSLAPNLFYPSNVTRVTQRTHLTLATSLASLTLKVYPRPWKMFSKSKDIHGIQGGVRTLYNNERSTDLVLTPVARAFQLHRISYTVFSWQGFHSEPPSGREVGQMAVVSGMPVPHCLDTPPMYHSKMKTIVQIWLANVYPWSRVRVKQTYLVHHQNNRAARISVHHRHTI